MKSLEKENLIAKLNIKDYNRELERVLQQKQFSKLCNNLLLSMLYKIENSYEDYKKVKVQVPTKKEYIEELIKIIQEDCKKIDIVKYNTEEALELGDKKSKAVKELKQIVTYENELAVLQGIYELNTKQFKINSYDEIREKAISKMLNQGEIAFKCEVLRDFDGWSWNTNINEIDDLYNRLFYQLMVYLLGFEFLNNNKNMSIKMLEEKLKENYKPATAEKLLKVINQVAIEEYIINHQEEVYYLKKVKEDLATEFELMSNKKEYIEKVTQDKKNKRKEIEKIDKYINDDLELKKEYIKQNEKLPQDKRVFSLSDFSEKVLEQRNKLNQEVNRLTEMLKPTNFVKEKNSLERNLNYINELDLETFDNKELVSDFINIFLKAMEEQILKINTKKEIIEKIYELRYINRFNLNGEKLIGKTYKKQIEKVQKKIITVACNLKAITIFSQDVEENFRIYKNIFETKIIDLESAYIEVDKENNVKIYDDNSLECEENYNSFNDLVVRKNKRTKIFL